MDLLKYKPGMFITNNAEMLELHVKEEVFLINKHLGNNVNVKYVSLNVDYTVQVFIVTVNNEKHNGIYLIITNGFDYYQECILEADYAKFCDDRDIVKLVHQNYNTIKYRTGLMSKN